ncbi:YugN-like family protein [Thalassorhabdus alkalitolerans]|uniref:YugN-like family protein n=1 Tax=Thalassorhabdus alkalitolerans TaxID=2282697 RepID=A0ABW0YNK7_9BACI|nr:YugN-like family protein [Thalassobacillus sp. C254]
MIQLQSRIEEHKFKMETLKEKLQPLGYGIGGNWDYDHGYFDYKIDDDHGYHFLRLPFRTIDGEVETKGVTVELGRPFLLTHQYEEGIDDVVYNYNALFNQFQKPVVNDAAVPNKYLETGRLLIEELEATLLT